MWNTFNILVVGPSHYKWQQYQTNSLTQRRNYLTHRKQKSKRHSRMKKLNPSLHSCFFLLFYYAFYTNSFSCSGSPCNGRENHCYSYSLYLGSQCHPLSFYPRKITFLIGLFSITWIYLGMWDPLIGWPDAHVFLWEVKAKPNN